MAAGASWFETRYALLTVRIRHYASFSSLYPFAATTSQRAR